jgi:hypothetical protein
MAVQILSDMESWKHAAYDIIPGVNGAEESYRLKTTAEAYVVYGAMMVGMPDLDEKTAEEWLTRLRAWEIVDGPMLRDRDPESGELVPVPVTMDDLRPFFGTRTNVFPKETAARFRRRVGDAVLERASRM